ncbi:MAG: aspartate-semialdehyde dehydrogenase [Bacillota bacterium]|nr:aspartate-semialdehyde dehydrogenase [Bacillota bacterium]
MTHSYRVAVVGATGYVGQRFVTLLDSHPWFHVDRLFASPRSAGKSYRDAVDGRWRLTTPVPSASAALMVESSEAIEDKLDGIDLVFCAVDMPKDAVRELEERMARTETVVVSNNSAHRATPDVPMVVPEINHEHLALIPAQRRRLGTSHGFIAVKPNCSIQSYVPALSPLLDFGIEQLFVSTYQAISGAGKTFADWPEMVENLIPYIGGEEEKSEVEPLRIWGRFAGDHIVPATKPLISAQCYRVAVQEGHTASVSVSFREKPGRGEILERWAACAGRPQQLELPSAPRQFLHYFDEDNRPQPRLDADLEGGMAVSIGRLREDPILDWKFTCLSHNTLRGAAGGAVLTAELLAAEGYLAR